MTRAYELKRRAERMEETRRRIVEAAIELHGTVGPARASVSAIAERAGVQRQTYYRHFPDQRSLFAACSGLYMERNPLPDAEGWRAVTDPAERARHGLAELYDYYAANEPMLSRVIRDADVDALTAEIVATTIAPVLGEFRTALAEGLAGDDSSRLFAALELALDFGTWSILVGRGGLTTQAAVDVVIAMLGCLD